NPHTSSHGPSGAELTRLPLNAPTSNQKSNCNASCRKGIDDGIVDLQINVFLALHNPHLGQLLILKYFPERQNTEDHAFEFVRVGELFFDGEHAPILWPINKTDFGAGPVLIDEIR
ncbi:hypothetical protein, partial [Bradyrhizobium sp. 168]|uniref:hypothetical protein n=1 Tax=Bradyrhizobium sp. 168 TaxID=2782639 RepID=UPI001FF8FFB1